MADRERVGAAGDFPIAAWNDEPVREALWGMLRDRCAQEAATRPGWALTSDPDIQRDVVSYYLIDDTLPEPVAVVTTQEDAEFVKLRLYCWASPQGGET